MSVSAFQNIQKLRPGDHLCCIYQTEEEHSQVVTMYVRLGLQDGHKVMYIVDIHTAETVMEYMRAEGIDIDACRESGQFEIFTRHDTYTRNSVFDPDAMIDLLRSETEKALEEGYEALRVTGEMTWALTGLPGTERLIEYENKLNHFIPEHNCIAICQYDKREFSPPVLLDVLRTHPFAIIGTEVYENFYYLPPEQLLGDNPQLSELDHWIKNLREYDQAKQELDKERRFVDAILETSGAIIVIIDVEGRIIRINETAEKIVGYSREELAEKSLWHLVPDEEKENVGKIFNMLMGGSYPNTHENHWIAKNGEKRFIAWTNTVVPDAGGNVETVISTGIDITARKREMESRVEKLEAEIARMEGFSAPATSVTGKMYAQQPLSETSPEECRKMREEYESILQDRMEERIYKTDNRISSRLRTLAEVLGRTDAGPKDVIELHVNALKNISSGASHKRARAITEEGRLLALELMGYIVSFYRNQNASSRGIDG